MIGLNKHIVAVVEHDPAWVVLGADACKEVLEAAGSLLRDVQHVGSTSVPGLVAKPIVDIAGGAATFESIPELIGRLTSIDFIYLGDSAENGGHLFVRESSPDVRTLHLHIVKYGDLQWRNYLRFRDFLRTSALACEQYRSLKLELARKFAGDRESYTEAKRALIEQLLRNAPEVGASTHMHLLVDVDGVLQFERSDLEAQVSGALQWSGDPRAFRKILFSDPEFHRALRGECDFLSFLERLLSERQPRLKPGDYLDSWMSDFTLNRGLIDRLAHVQCRSLSLASNQEQRRGSRIAAEYECFSHIGRKYFSYEIGHRKPERGFFEFILKDLGAQPSEVLLIDDLAENVDVARDLGMRAIRFEGNLQLYRELHELGLMRTESEEGLASNELRSP